MNLLVSYLYSTGGSLASSSLLLQALARHYAADRFYVICASNSEVRPKLSHFSNVEILAQTPIIHREVNRFLLGYSQLGKIAQKTGADLLWTMNTGAYRRFAVPQLLSITNAFQLYPWDDVKHLATPGKFHLATLRRVFRRSLVHADRAVVQTDLMKSYLQHDLLFQRPVDVIPKSVESMEDLGFEPIGAEQRRLLAEVSGRECAFTFLYLASCDLHKNHLLLVRVARILRERKACIRIAVSVSEKELCRVGGNGRVESVRSGHLVPLGWSPRGSIKCLY